MRTDAGRVSAVVVWFGPTLDYVRNLSTYADSMHSVLIVDNSPVRSDHLVPVTANVHYHWNGENKGIAAALNFGFACAMEQGAQWVLTMDQDSAFERTSLMTLLAEAARANDDVAILAPNWLDSASSADVALVECDSVITSGSLVRTEAFSRVGGYNEALFLDEVDHEFGYRLRRAGYRILRAQTVRMHHVVGEPIRKKVLWKYVQSTNHSAVRKYYMTRSRLYMRKHFPEFGSPYLEMILTDAVKVLLVEEQKVQKLLFMLRGCVDHLRGVSGRLRHRRSS